MVQKNYLNKKLIIICGPTASGKTALAVECAKLLETEIISADSLYIYKGLDIGTSKPSLKEMQGIKHHLIDIVSPKNEFSVSDFKGLAEPIIQDLFSKNKVPIICGGTGFYINSILYDLSYGNSASNLEARKKYMDLAKKFGNRYVYEVLYKNDKESAEKLHYNDLKRVVRALEIFESGQKKSEIRDDFVAKYEYDAYSIKFDRDTLYNRINNRVDEMINNGLIDEIKSLLRQGVTKSDQCMQGIGYKEILDYLDEKISIEQAVEQIKLNTRHYAKRQETFFKRFNNLVYLQPDDVNKLAKRIIDNL